METDLVVRRNGALKRLTLSRPGKRNALSGDLVDALSAEIEASKSDGTGVLSIEGAGMNFSAGFDFSESGGLSDGDIALRFIRIELLLSSIANASFATLAFAHGATFGAAADLFAACQLRYAAPGTTFRMPGLSFGVALGTRRLARLVGADRARSILLDAGPFTAEEAVQWGFVSHICDRSDFDGAVDRLAGSIALDDYARSTLLGIVASGNQDQDLAELVRTLARPGLKDRLQGYWAKFSPAPATGTEIAR
jgi:enoyl-CoA hydratase